MRFSRLGLGIVAGVVAVAAVLVVQALETRFLGAPRRTSLWATFVGTGGAILWFADRFGLLASAYSEPTLGLREQDVTTPHTPSPSTPSPTLTIGEVVATLGHSPRYTPARQRCLLCEADANVEVREAKIQIECASCGQYYASPEAAHALDSLVTYRGPGLAEMRNMLATYRESRPDVVPTIEFQRVIPGASTWYLTADPPVEVK